MTTTVYISIMLKSLVFFAIIAATAAGSHRTFSEDGVLNFYTGGKIAQIEEFPYHVSVHYYNYTLCSGVIISEQWVLTAATCFINPQTMKASVRAGSTHLFEEGSQHEIDEITIHPSRNSTINLYRYDIALVHVKSPFHLDETRQPITMFETADQVEPGSVGVISGWGGFMHHPAPELRTEELVIIPKSECDAYYPSDVDMEEEVCVMYDVEEDVNPCTGDYGSPLAIDGRLAGVVSLRIMHCGTEREGIPTFHTEVAPYRTWIKSVTGV